MKVYCLISISDKESKSKVVETMFQNKILRTLSLSRLFAQSVESENDFFREGMKKRNC